MGRWWRRLVALVQSESVRSEAVLLDAVLLDAVPTSVDPRPGLRRVAAEALIHQDAAERVLRLVRRHAPLGEVAPQAGPLVRRLFALRDELPVCSRADDVRLRHTLDIVLHHHAMVLATAQELLAYEWRSETIRRQVESFDGLGAPAQLLEQVYAELAASPTANLSRPASTAR